MFSAGTEATSVKVNAVTVMAELGIDLSAASSKTLFDLPDPWNFDYVVTVCDSAAEDCPRYPARTTMRYCPFTDPSGGSLERWRTVRGPACLLVHGLRAGAERRPAGSRQLWAESRCAGGLSARLAAPLADGRTDRYLRADLLWTGGRRG